MNLSDNQPCSAEHFKHSWQQRLIPFEVSNWRAFSTSSTPRVLLLLGFALTLTFISSHTVRADESSLAKIKPFFRKYCADCHGDGADEGGFELSSLGEDLTETDVFDRWQLVQDRVRNGVMPPPDSERPTMKEIRLAMLPVTQSLGEAQRERHQKFGRVTARRLNSVEFGTTLSDLLHTPLDIVDLLPEDAKAGGFSTVGDALNVSSVQMEAYLEAIDAAMDQAVRFTKKPKTQTFRLSLLNNLGYMQTYRSQHPALPVVDGMLLFAREKMSHHHALWGHYVVPHTGTYRIRVSAYKVNSEQPIALTLRAGGNGHKETLTVKHRHLNHFEIDSDDPRTYEWEGELLRGHFIHMDPSELPVYRFVKSNKKGAEKYEQIQYKGPGVGVQWMEIEGPIIEQWPPLGQQVLFGGVATKPIEGAENPDPNEQLHSPPVIPADPLILPTDWPPQKTWTRLAGELNDDAKFVAQDYSRRRGQVVRKILRGKHPPASPLTDFQAPPHNLPIGSPLPSYGGEPIYQNVNHPGELVRTVTLASTDPKADSDRLIRRLLPQAFRRPVNDDETDRYVALVHRWLDDGVSFEDAMRTGYKAIFTSPSFLFHQSSLNSKTVGSSKQDQYAIAERLTYFLWCTAPDEELLRLAKHGKLSDPKVLRQQTERLLNDDRSRRFVKDFLGQWLDLHQIDFTSPDIALFPEYDSVLHWSMLQESYAFFEHLLNHDLPAKNLIESDFVMVNRRLAEHYQMTGVAGMKPTAVQLDKESVRGGVMTLASVLKVTANGSNTSPVVRGVWVLERILGTPPPPPPPGIPAVEPDIRGAVTIRDQLEAHRNDADCASCHAIIDPPGMALESFDPVGRYRKRYRVMKPNMVDAKPADRRVRYSEGLPVDSAYTLSDGRTFADIRELKALYCQDEAGIARNLANRLLVYATGARCSHADEDEIERIVASAKSEGYGVRSIVHAVVQSDLFRQR